MLLQGAQAALQVQRIQHVRALEDAEFRVFSQWGEDGIIEWLISRLPGIPRSAVEFGVEDYLEANTRFLVQNRNWRALVMDGSHTNISRLREHRMFWRHNITAVTAFVDRDNINALLGDHGFSGEVGILNIDIDGNDYWVWQAIDVIKPWIAIVEYNGLLGDLRSITIPYDAGFSRMRAHSSGQYFGTSVRALERLAALKGYTLLGSPRTGINAFFVRNDLAGAFEAAISDRRPYPTLVRDSRSPDRKLTFNTPYERLRLLADLPVCDIDTEKTLCLGATAALYSDRWKGLMGIPVTASV